MGTENYQYLIRETDRTGIAALNKIRDKKEFSDLKTKYWGKTKGAQWLARAEYVKHFKKDPEEFKKFIKSYKNKPLDEAAVRKGYKILTKK